MDFQHHLFLYGLLVILLLFATLILVASHAPDMFFPGYKDVGHDFYDITTNFVSIAGQNRRILQNQYSFGEESVNLLSEFELNQDSQNQNGGSQLRVSNASLPFYRHPVNCSIRDSYNDIYLNTFSARFIPSEYESEYQQPYRLVMFTGSKQVIEPLPEGVAGESNPIRKDDPFNVTIISQTTKERLFFIPYFLRRWKGPISITVFTHPSEEAEIRRIINESHFPDRLLLTLYIATHPNQDCMVRKYKWGTYCVSRTIYPLNRLRNIAIKRVRTTHFLVLDMDTWPSVITYDAIMQLPADYLKNNFFVTILPIFSFTPDYVKPTYMDTLKNSVKKSVKKIPSSKEQLVSDFEKGFFTIFRPQSLTHVLYFIHTKHKNYLPDDWFHRSPEEPVIFMNCFRERFLEPYVMVKRSKKMPLFDEAFINYGFNKVQWIEHLRYTGYEFYILNNGFAVDIPHYSSSFAKAYRFQFFSKRYSMINLYRKFLSQLRQEPDRSRQLLCLSRNVSLSKYRF